MHLSKFLINPVPSKEQIPICPLDGTTRYATTAMGNKDTNDSPQNGDIYIFKSGLLSASSSLVPKLVYL